MRDFIQTYQQTTSIESRVIQALMGLFRMKRIMEKKIVNNTYNKHPAAVPKSIYKRFQVDYKVYHDRKVWSISPESADSKTVILYLHGGAYYANITEMHWQFIEQLLIKTNAVLLVPDYPLAPESGCFDTYHFLDSVYADLITDVADKTVVFMGDSSGGGLALGFAMKIRDEGLRQPDQLILFSPWLDVSMSNPDIAKYAHRDKILSVKALKHAGEKYAGLLSTIDFRVSPVYGDFRGLANISVFIGTNDVLFADVQKMKHILESQQINFNYFGYAGLFHDWIVVPSLKETKDVIDKVVEILPLCI